MMMLVRIWEFFRWGREGVSPDSSIRLVAIRLFGLTRARGHDVDHHASHRACDVQLRLLVREIRLFAKVYESDAALRARYLPKDEGAASRSAVGRRNHKKDLISLVETDWGWKLRV
jgi:hypothetical protein